MKLIIAITGASGSIYALQLLQQLEKAKAQLKEVAIILSDTGKQVWEYELPDVSYKTFSFPIVSNNDLFASCASGSANYNAMIICPCSMGTLGRIASGISNDLITRSADVMLKERRQLILVPREMPLNTIHINNMKIVTEAGALIMPASPSFYSHPKTITDLVNTVVERLLQQVKLDVETFEWKKNNLK